MIDPVEASTARRALLAKGFEEAKIPPSPATTIKTADSTASPEHQDHKEL